MSSVPEPDEFSTPAAGRAITLAALTHLESTLRLTQHRLDRYIQDVVERDQSRNGRQGRADPLHPDRLPGRDPR